ncbi:MAG: hypothetical protein DMF88_07655 [Acidobacteria bacterium]|nr:MAG: hypothetical protein DMF88_07655 [Acidobacteriota bacterium]
MNVRKALLVLSVLLIAGSRIALAQDAPITPRLQTPTTDLANQRLTLGVWFGGGYDNRLGRSLTPESIALFGPDNSEAQLGVGSTFALSGRVFSFDGDVQTGLRLDSAAQRPWSSDHQAALNTTIRFSRRLRLESRNAVRYAALNPLVEPPLAAAAGTATPAQVTSVALPFAVRQALSATTDTALRYDFHGRSSLLVSNGLIYTDTATFDPNSSRYLKTHDLDVGMDYRRPLPFSRRTIVAASFGPSIVSERDRQSLRVIGDASLTHTPNRTWQIKAEYHRSMWTIEGLAAPLLSTTITGGVVASVGRRNVLMALVGYTDGNISIDQTSATSVMSRSAEIRWHAALTRRVGLVANTFYGRLRYGPQVASMLVGVPSDASHVGARVFLTFWQPLSRN